MTTDRDTTVWARPYGARERILLSTQRKWDVRNLPPLWLWRMLREGDAGGTVPDDVMWQSPRIQRRYAAPIAAHLFVDWSAKVKGQKKGPGVETNLIAKVGMSRAECRRLGNLLRTQDDLEGLVSEPGGSDFLYLPRPGDIFRFADDHFEVLQIDPPERYGPTGIPVVWKGTAHLFRDDATTPGQTLPEPPTPQPSAVRPGGAPWRG
jgi:hypothetical protein